MTDQPSAREMSELLPCPFCGGKAERFDDHDTGSVNEGGSCIQCKQCGASSPMHFDRKEHLRSSWNERMDRLAAQSASAPERTGEPVAWRYKHSSHRDWSYVVDKPDGPSIHLFRVEPLYATPAPTFTDKQGRKALAEGCRSAVSPCSHQKASPYTLCDVCQKDTLKTVTIVIPSGYRDAAEFLKDCQFERADATPAARPQADVREDCPHKTMTLDEYLAEPRLKGWHSVCFDCDGVGGVGIRYHGLSSPQSLTLDPATVEGK